MKTLKKILMSYVKLRYAYVKLNEPIKISQSINVEWRT